MLPRSVTVCGYKFKVCTGTDLKEDGKEVWGTCDTDEKVITIDSSRPIKEQRQILLHEVIHAILFLTGNNEMLSEDGKQEEAIVIALEHGLYPLINSGVLK